MEKEKKEKDLIRLVKDLKPYDVIYVIKRLKEGTRKLEKIKKNLSKEQRNTYDKTEQYLIAEEYVAVLQVLKERKKELKIVRDVIGIFSMENIIGSLKIF